MQQVKLAVILLHKRESIGKRQLRITREIVSYQHALKGKVVSSQTGPVLLAGVSDQCRTGRCPADGLRGRAEQRRHDGPPPRAHDNQINTPFGSRLSDGDIRLAIYQYNLPVEPIREGLMYMFSDCGFEQPLHVATFRESGEGWHIQAMRDEEFCAVRFRERYCIAKGFVRFRSEVNGTKYALKHYPAADYHKPTTPLMAPSFPGNQRATAVPSLNHYYFKDNPARVGNMTTGQRRISQEKNGD